MFFPFSESIDLRSRGPAAGSGKKIVREVNGPFTSDCSEVTTGRVESCGAIGPRGGVNRTDHGIQEALQSVSCLCGGRGPRPSIPMNRDPRLRPPAHCANQHLSFAVTMDQTTMNSLVSPILPAGAFKPEGESLATVHPKGAEAPSSTRLPEDAPASATTALSRPIR